MMKEKSSGQRVQSARDRILAAQFVKSIILTVLVAGCIGLVLATRCSCHRNQRTSRPKHLPSSSQPQSADNALPASQLYPSMASEDHKKLQDLSDAYQKLQTGSYPRFILITPRNHTPTLMNAFKKPYFHL